MLIEAGKIREVQPNIAATDAPSVVANQMNPGHIDAVFIAGKVRKWRGSLVGVDTARIMRLAQEAREAVMRRGNIRVDLIG